MNEQVFRAWQEIARPNEFKPKRISVERAELKKLVDEIVRLREMTDGLSDT